MRVTRALLAVHFVSRTNLGLRSAGVQGVLASVVLMFFAAIGVGTSVVGIFGFGGYAAATQGYEANLPWVALALTGLSFGGALSAVLSGEGRELDWERFGLFPIEPLALVFSESVAMLSDPLMLLAVVSQVALAVGVMVGAPTHAGQVALTCVGAIFAQSMVRLYLASAFTRAIQRLKAFSFLFALGPLVVLHPFVKYLKNAEAPAGETALLEKLRFVSDVLHTLGASTPAALWLEPWGLDVASLWAVLAPLALLLLLAVAAARSVLSESDEEVTAQSTTAERLWSFTSPVWGLARLQVTSLLASQLGRFSLIAPLIWVLPITILRTVPAGFSPVAVSGALWFFVPTTMTNFLWNQFGLDRGAVKGLFLLPVTERQILDGKALGYGLFGASQLLVVVLVARFILHTPLSMLCTGALVSSLRFLENLTVGQWLSAIFPRPVPRKGLKSGQAGLVFVVLSLSVLLVTMGPLVGLWYLLSAAGPWAMPPVLLALNLAMLTFNRLSATQAGRMVALRRERIVETLG